MHIWYYKCFFNFCMKQTSSPCFHRRIILSGKSNTCRSSRQDLQNTWADLDCSIWIRLYCHHFQVFTFKLILISNVYCLLHLYAFYNTIIAEEWIIFFQLVRHNNTDEAIDSACCAYFVSKGNRSKPTIMFNPARYSF